jgi:hypothetical protein
MDWTHSLVCGFCISIMAQCLGLRLFSRRGLLFLVSAAILAATIADGAKLL